MASHAKPTPDERKSMPDAGTDEDILIPRATMARDIWNSNNPLPGM
jgi:hypothetical protein